MRHRALLLAVALLCAGCDWAENRDRFDREPLVRSWVDELFLPTYAELETRARELDAAVSEYLAAPDPVRLDAARSAWSATMARLQREAPFRIGPSMERRFDLYFWPTRPALVERTIADTIPLTPERFESGIAAAAKGMAALELLLFGPDSLRSTGTGNERDIEYWRGVSGDVVRVAQEIHTEWSDPVSGYAVGMLDPGRLDEFETLHEIVAAVTNQWIIAVEDVKNRKLGRPLGVDAGGTPRPEAVESPYTDLALDHAIQTLEGVRSVFRGAGSSSVGLLDYVERFDSDLAAALEARLAEAIEAVEAIPTPLTTAVLNDPATVEHAFESLRALLILSKTELVTTLGITLTFSDNDGDG